MLLLGLIVLALSLKASATWNVKKDKLNDWTNDTLFAEASAGQGILLTCCDMHLIQLRTRRPVLLDGGGLDLLPYTLEAGPEMNRILREVYGIDLFDPPEEAKGGGRIPRMINKTLWESRTPEQWKEIKKHFGVTDIMMYADWHLKLPEVIRNQEFVLYRISE
ncbi:MAG: hypothetical protein HY731_14250 [Candidatus Tectomicrobia bacterium]|nr:hypothetical protein [Candidatus Tectomicrobia bacterium]